jgi:SH3-like domain-containing protein
MFANTSGGPIRAHFRLLTLLLGTLLLLAPVAAQAQSNPSGLPLPRFASTKSDPINVRVGPGERYDIAWVYLKSGVPIEIVQEFDTWRKIRDVDGEEGWVHQNLLSGTRGGYVTPVLANSEIPLLASRSDEAGVRARLGPGLKVTIQQCDGTWCEISVTGQTAERTATYSGFVRQEELWGVYPDEVFD